MAGQLTIASQRQRNTLHYCGGCPCGSDIPVRRLWLTGFRRNWV